MGTLPRALLLEAELHLIASRYRQALVAAIALQLATTPAGGPGGGSSWSFRDRYNATESRGDELPTNTFTAAAAVVEMVSCYQLGDRGRALELRDTLRSVLPLNSSSVETEIQISQHLQAR